MKSIFFILLFSASLVFAQGDTIHGESDFNDAPLSEALVIPSWFKISSGDLRDDLQDALANGKDGLIIYFGQNHCAYCEQFIKNNMQANDIENFIRKHYNVIHFDIWSAQDIYDMDGEIYTEREFSVHYNTNFTPSLIFYNRDGKPVFRLRGYYPPYKFRAALKYVTEEFYKKESFRDYLARAEPGMFFYEEGLNEREFFMSPPYDLPATLKQTKRALMVSFEQSTCHACDLLHSSPMNEPKVLKELNNLNNVQLNMWSDTPVTTPDGTVTTAKKWADQLGIFYAPTLIFFDPDGKEILRIDSVVKFYRLLAVLKYINQRGYLEDKNLQSWLLKQRAIK